MHINWHDKNKKLYALIRAIRIRAEKNTETRKRSSYEMNEYVNNKKYSEEHRDRGNIRDDYP